MIDARDRSHDLFTQCGEAMWGDQWQTAMAEALGVSDRTVRRWVSGERIKPGVWVDIMRIMQDRSLLLDDLANEARELGGGV